MIFKFQSIDDLLKSCEKEIIDYLYDCNLIEKWNKDTKKVIFYFFTRKFLQTIIDDEDMFFHHCKKLSTEHELFKYYDHDQLTKYLNSLCNKMSKMTNRVVCFRTMTEIPESGSLENLDGSIIDEILLLENKGKPSLEVIYDFLNKNNLKDLYKAISTKII